MQSNDKNNNSKKRKDDQIAYAEPDAQERIKAGKNFHNVILEFTGQSKKDIYDDDVEITKHIKPPASSATAPSSDAYAQKIPFAVPINEYEELTRETVEVPEHGVDGNGDDGDQLMIADSIPNTVPIKPTNPIAKQDHQQNPANHDDDSKVMADKKELDESNNDDETQSTSDNANKPKPPSTLWEKAKSYDKRYCLIVSLCIGVLLLILGLLGFFTEPKTPPPTPHPSPSTNPPGPNTPPPFTNSPISTPSPFDTTSSPSPVPIKEKDQCLYYIQSGPFNMTTLTPEIRMRFTVQDMCLNYNGSDHCFMKSKQSPYAGTDMILESGAWYFNDLVTYQYIHSNDTNGNETLLIRMEVHHAHDPYRDKRVFVYNSMVNPHLGCVTSFEKYEIFIYESNTNETRASGRTRCSYDANVNETNFESNLVEFFNDMPLFVLLDIEGLQWVMVSPERTGIFTGDPDVNGTSEFGFLVGFNETGQQFQYKLFPSNLTAKTSAIQAELINDLKIPFFQKHFCVDDPSYLYGSNSSSVKDNGTNLTEESEFGYFLFTENVKNYFEPLEPRSSMIERYQNLNRSYLVTNTTDDCAANCIKKSELKDIATCYDLCYKPVLEQHQKIQNRILRELVETKYDFESWNIDINHVDVSDTAIPTAIFEKVDSLVNELVQESDYEEFKQYRVLQEIAQSSPTDIPGLRNGLFDDFKFTSTESAFESIKNRSASAIFSNDYDSGVRNLEEDPSGSGKWMLITSNKMISEIKSNMKNLDDVFENQVSQVVKLNRPPREDAAQFLERAKVLSQNLQDVEKGLYSIETTLSKVHNFAIIGFAIKLITTPIFQGVEAGIFVLDLCSKIPVYGEIFGVIKEWVKDMLSVLKKGVKVVDSAINPEPVLKYTLPALKIFESTRRYILQGSGTIDMYINPVAEHLGFIEKLDSTFNNLKPVVNDLLIVINQIIDPVLEFIRKVINPLQKLIDNVAGAEGVVEEFKDFLVRIRKVWDNSIGNFLLKVDQFLKIKIDIPALASKYRGDVKNGCINALIKPCLKGCAVVGEVIDFIVDVAKSAVQAVENAIENTKKVVQAVVDGLKKAAEKAAEFVSNTVEKVKKWFKKTFGRRQLVNLRSLSIEPHNMFLYRVLSVSDSCEDLCKHGAEIPCTVESEILIPRFLDIVPVFTVKDILVGVSVVLSAVNPLQFISDLVQEKLSTLAMDELPDPFVKEILLPMIDKAIEEKVSYMKSFEFLPPNIRCFAKNALTPKELMSCSPIKEIDEGIDSLFNNKVGATCQLTYMCDSSVSNMCLEKCCDKNLILPNGCSSCDENGKCNKCGEGKYLIKTSETKYECLTLKKDGQQCMNNDECAEEHCEKGVCCSAACGFCKGVERFVNGACVPRLSLGQPCSGNGDCLSNQCAGGFCCATNDSACKICGKTSGLCSLCDGSGVVLADGKCQKLRDKGDTCIKNNGQTISSGCKSGKCLGNNCCDESIIDSNCVSCGFDGKCNKCSSKFFLNPNRTDKRMLSTGLEGMGSITNPRTPKAIPTTFFASPRVDFTKVPPNLQDIAKLYDSFGKKIESIAVKLSISPKILASIVFAESAGTPFVNDRVIIRFDPSVFKKYYLASDFSAYFDLTAMKWRSNPNNNNWKAIGGSQSAMWEVMIFAQTLSDTAALKATSFGIAQIMGFNHASINYVSVQDMFLDFSESVEGQFQGFELFIKANLNLLTACQTESYEDIAKYYNGPGNIPVYSQRLMSYSQMYLNFMSILETSSSGIKKCTAFGLDGACTKKDDCKQGESVALSTGCINENEVCCVREIECTPKGIFKTGICKDVSDCNGDYETSYVGYCPGAKNIQCCVNAVTLSPTLKPTTSAPTSASTKICIDKYEDGRSCTSDEQCLSVSCSGNHCCSAAADRSTGCIECNSFGTCEKCASTHYFRADRHDCVPKLPGGSECASKIGSSPNAICASGFCKGNCCNAGYEDNCFSCGTNGKCTNCANGFFLRDGKCEALLNNGGSCSASNQCKSASCKGGVCCGGTGLDNGCNSCSQSNGVCNSCIANYYFDSGSSQCKAAQPNGSSCSVSISGMCSSGSCKERCCGANGQSSGCSKCDGAGNCEICAPDYYLSNGSCAKRSGPDEPCDGSRPCIAGLTCKGRCCGEFGRPDECLECGGNNGGCKRCKDNFLLASVKCIPKVLSDFHGGCVNVGVARSAECASATHNWCWTNGKGGHGVAVEAVNNVFGVSCFNGNYGGVEMSDLRQRNSGCNTILDSQTESCLSAINIWCNDSGRGRAGYSQELGPTGLGVVCFNPNYFASIPLAILKQVISECDDISTMWCFSAVHRWCNNNGKGNTGIPQGKWIDYKKVPGPFGTTINIPIPMVTVACFDHSFYGDVQITR